MTRALIAAIEPQPAPARLAPPLNPKLCLSAAQATGKGHGPRAVPLVM